ncbi:unnamed protein product [Amoebophrya sp. A25]|nr:unnamed protein product [Amoebophrya sp. A25]|eukprot:GSA25T00010471001.1
MLALKALAEQFAEPHLTPDESGLSRFPQSRVNRNLHVDASSTGIVISRLLSTNTIRKPPSTGRTSFLLSGSQLVRGLGTLTQAFAKTEADCVDMCLGKEQEGQPACRRCDGILARAEMKLGPGDPEPEAIDRGLTPAEPVAEPVAAEETMKAESLALAADEELQDPTLSEADRAALLKEHARDNEPAAPREDGIRQDRPSEWQCAAGKYLERGPFRRFAWNDPAVAIATKGEVRCSSIGRHNLPGDCAIMERGLAERVCIATPGCDGITGQQGVWYLRDGKGPIRDALGWAVCKAPENRPKAELPIIVGPDAMPIESGVGLLGMVVAWYSSRAEAEMEPRKSIKRKTKRHHCIRNDCDSHAFWS